MMSSGLTQRCNSLRTKHTLSAEQVAQRATPSQGDRQKTRATSATCATATLGKARASSIADGATTACASNASTTTRRRSTHRWAVFFGTRWQRSMARRLPPCSYGPAGTSKDVLSPYGSESFDSGRRQMRLRRQVWIPRARSLSDFSAPAGQTRYTSSFIAKGGRPTGQLHPAPPRRLL